MKVQGKVIEKVKDWQSESGSGKAVKGQSVKGQGKDSGSRSRKGNEAAAGRQSKVNGEEQTDLVRIPSSTHIGHGSASPSAHSHAPIRACTIDVTFQSCIDVFMAPQSLQPLLPCLLPCLLRYLLPCLC